MDHRAAPPPPQKKNDIGCPSSSTAPSSELHHPRDDTGTHPDRRARMIFSFFLTFIIGIV
jgi:hypothetical protein